MNSVVTEVREALISFSDELTRLSGERFFKEPVKLYGIKAAAVKTISREYFKEIDRKSKDEIFAICDELWQSGFLEESAIACNWSYYVHGDYLPADFEVFESWVKKYISNWASCDTLCNHTVGTFVEMYPEFLNRLKDWARSRQRWVKRASAVSLIIPARKGKFLGDILEIAGILHSDNDDMVQKGYGWMLKAASESHRQEVFDYVMSKKDTMPRTALRYAIEKMPGELKALAMAR